MLGASASWAYQANV